MTDRSTTDFNVGDVVQHVFYGRYATVTKVSRRLLTVELNLGGQVTRWQPSSVRKVS